MSTRQKKMTSISQVINVSDAKSRLSALLEEVAKGRRFILGKSGKPVATLAPYSEIKAKRSFGALQGKIKIDQSFELSSDEIDKLFR